MKIKEFIEGDFVDYSSYSTLRTIPSYIDGLKNSSRKILFTFLEKNIKEKTRVDIASNLVVSFSSYIHGSCDGTVVKMCQDFRGTNNIPYFSRDGFFGTTLNPSASAIRYIKTKNEPYIYDIFKKEDTKVLVAQEFEGAKIEPRFYVPTLPMLLVNGADGIATGFASSILPRNYKELVKYINGKKCDLTPYFNGFKGTVERVEDKNQWVINGKYNLISKNTIEIIELPIGYRHSSYIKVLDKLEDDKVIISYKDLCDSKKDLFRFQVKFRMQDNISSKSEEEMMKLLKIQKTHSENFTTIDENNKIRIFESVEDLLDAYIKVKEEYIIKRKEYLINEMKLEMGKLASKCLFIREVNSGNIKIQKQSKEQIMDQISKYERIFKVEGKYDYLLNMSIYRLTEEELEKYMRELKVLKDSLEDLNNKTPKDIWNDDIKNLKVEGK